jgi:hypothetical protein
MLTIKKYRCWKKGGRLWTCSNGGVHLPQHRSNSLQYKDGSKDRHVQDSRLRWCVAVWFFRKVGNQSSMTQSHISADLNPQQHRCENLKSHNWYVVPDCSLWLLRAMFLLLLEQNTHWLLPTSLEIGLQCSLSDSLSEQVVTRIWTEY